MQVIRCSWAKSDLMAAYHDHEWGVPQHDDRVLFEFLILEGAQAGLSWETVLKKRASYRRAFDGFDPESVARYDGGKIGALMTDTGIIRNRLKIQAAIRNAQAFLQIQQEFDSFDTYLWRFVDGHPAPALSPASERVTRNEVSDRLSKDLLQRGCKFVGTTICYALMQAVGMVNDHEIGCFRRREIEKGFAHRSAPPASNRPR